MRDTDLVLRFGHVGIRIGDRAQFVAAAIEDAALESNIVISAWQVSPVGCVVGQRYNFDDLSDRTLGPWTRQAALHDITQSPDLNDACCSSNIDQATAARRDPRDGRCRLSRPRALPLAQGEIAEPSGHQSSLHPAQKRAIPIRHTCAQAQPGGRLNVFSVSWPPSSTG